MLGRFLYEIEDLVQGRRGRRPGDNLCEHPSFDISSPPSVLLLMQRAGRVHLRRHRAGVPGGAGRGVQAADGGPVVRHDGLRGRLPQELKALRQLQQEDHGLQRKR